MHPELGMQPLSGRPRRALHGVRRGLLLGLCLWLAADHHTADAKKAKPSGGNATIEALFDGVQPAIRECALTHGIYKGATAVELQATIMVARDGRVFSAQVIANLTPKADGKKADPLQTCVGDTLRKMKFPESGDTFRKLLRNWKFATA